MAAAESFGPVHCRNRRRGTGSGPVLRLVQPARCGQERGRRESRTRPGADSGQRHTQRTHGEETKTKRGRAVYARRKAIVEPVFGQIHTRQGRHVLLRGLEQAAREWELLAVCHKPAQTLQNTGKPSGSWPPQKPKGRAPEPRRPLRARHEGRTEHDWSARPHRNRRTNPATGQAAAAKVTKRQATEPLPAHALGGSASPQDTSARPQLLAEFGEAVTEV
ncbi:transposase [Pseudarthrobacter albicanus]|uniref:transposase n=1 Tax=Pseudarthrobacter albicanus TaxID=2823873 RepID=UPI001BAE506A